MFQQNLIPTRGETSTFRNRYTNRWKNLVLLPGVFEAGGVVIFVVGQKML